MSDYRFGTASSGRTRRSLLNGIGPADVTRYQFRLPIDGVARVRNRNRTFDAGDDELLTVDFPIHDRVELVGSPTVRVTVVPTGRGTTRLMFALQRVSDGEVSTINDQVTPVAVEEPTELELDLVAVHDVFERGDTLRLGITTRDEHLLDVAVPTDEGMFIDADERPGAKILGTGNRTAELDVPFSRRSRSERLGPPTRRRIDDRRGTDYHDQSIGTT